MHSTAIHEDILRHLWTNQYLNAERLATLDGRKLKVVSPGIVNRDGGPDFRDGVVILDEQTYRGEIEFHRYADDWYAHLHNTDPKYNSVILHVVLYAGPNGPATLTASGRPVPVVAIGEFLSFPLEKIIEHARRDEHLSRSASLRCHRLNDEVQSDLLERWIGVLFRERLTEKVVYLYRRLVGISEEHSLEVLEPSENYAPQPGKENPDDIPIPGMQVDPRQLRSPFSWEQLLYEECMDGLGYSKNRVPFGRLANRVSVPLLRSLSPQAELTPLEIEAVLFHISGLLPEAQTVRDQQSKIRLHQLRSTWNDLAVISAPERLLSREVMHSADWVISPTRPSNFPTARVAAASVLVHRIMYRQLLIHIVTIINGGRSAAHEKLAQLLSALTIEEDSFWSFHYSFTESSPRRHALLGDARTYDLIINTLIPLCSLYAVIFDVNDLNDHCLELAAEIPRLEDNFITRKMERQLLKKKIGLHSALDQQGVIQLYKRYCRADRCNACEVGRTVFQN